MEVFYDLLSGSKLASINLKQIIPESSHIKAWKFSLDLQSLYYFEDSGALFQCNVQSFVEDSPGSIQLEHGDVKGEYCSYSSCHTGDVVWREKLFALHKSRTQKSSRPPWHHSSNTPDRKTKNTKEKHTRGKKISGFSRHENKCLENVQESYICAKIVMPPELLRCEDVHRNMSVTHKTVCFLCNLGKEVSVFFCDIPSGKIVTEKLVNYMGF